MGVVAVIKGIGQGSLFKHGRFCGVHNPFDSAAGKAKDPFINLGTLRKLSRHPSLEIRSAVANNLAGRLCAGLDPKKCGGFEQVVLQEALKGKKVLEIRRGYPLAEESYRNALKVIDSSFSGSFKKEVAIELKKQFATAVSDGTIAKALSEGALEALENDLREGKIIWTPDVIEGILKTIDSKFLLPQGLKEEVKSEFQKIYFKAMSDGRIKKAINEGMPKYIRRMLGREFKKK